MNSTKFDSTGFPQQHEIIRDIYLFCTNHQLNRKRRKRLALFYKAFFKQNQVIDKHGCPYSFKGCSETVLEQANDLYVDYRLTLIPGIRGCTPHVVAYDDLGFMPDSKDAVETGRLAIEYLLGLSNEEADTSNRGVVCGYKPDFTKWISSQPCVTKPVILVSNPRPVKIKNDSFSGMFVSKLP